MNSITAQKSIDLTSNHYGQLLYLNYPQALPMDVDFTQHLIAPVGQNILLELHGVSFSKEGCHFGSSIEVNDNYADNNGTWWELCDVTDVGMPLFRDFSHSSSNKLETHLDETTTRKMSYLDNGSPYATSIFIRSYLNTLHIRQKIKGLIGAKLNATIYVQEGNCRIAGSGGNICCCSAEILGMCFIVNRASAVLQPLSLQPVSL